MVLKLRTVPVSFYELQTGWRNKADGTFHDFHEKTIEGITFRQQFAQARNDEFPLAELFEATHKELAAGRFVIVGLPAGPDDWHDWIIYDEEVRGEFLAVAKGSQGTIYETRVKAVIAQVKGTDIGTYQENAKSDTGRGAKMIGKAGTP